MPIGALVDASYKISWDILWNDWGMLGKCLICNKLFTLRYRFTCTEA